MIGLLLTIASYEQDVLLFNVAVKGGRDEHAMDTVRFTAWYNKLVKYIVMITSFVAIGFVVLRRIQKNIWINYYLNN